MTTQESQNPINQAVIHVNRPYSIILAESVIHPPYANFWENDASRHSINEILNDDRHLIDRERSGQIFFNPGLFE